MSRRISYKFKSNGWDLDMVLTIEHQKPINNKIYVNWNIVGIDSGDGIVDLVESKLYTNLPVEIKPYYINGKTKIKSIFTIEKYRAIMLRSDYNE